MREMTDQPKTPIRTLIVDRNQESLMENKQALLASDQVEICAETTSFALAVSHVERSKPDFVFCGVDNNPDEAFAFIEKIRDKFPLLRIVCVGESNEPEMILRCFRTGADEYLIKPLQHETLLEMFPRLRTRHVTTTPPPQPLPEKKGHVIALWGSRGGSGVTTIACNLAHALALLHKTVLVDLHENQGDLGLFFDQQPTYSLQDIWGYGDRIDESLVESVTLKVDGGLHLLLQAELPGADPWSSEDFHRLIGILRSKFEYIILDIGHDVVFAQRVISEVDNVCLVVNQTIPSLYLASRKVQWLDEIGLDQNQIRIVINLFSSRSSVTQKHIAKTLRITDWILIRNDERNVLSAINQGKPLLKVSRWGKAGKDIVRLAKKISENPIRIDTQHADKEDALLRPLLSRQSPAEAMQ